MEQKPQVKQLQLKIDCLPLYADEVFITSRLKASQKNKRTAGFVNLRFVDMTTGRVIADITIDAITAEGLSEILKNKLEEIDKVQKSSNPRQEIEKISKQQPAMASKEEEPDYTG